MQSEISAHKSILIIDDHPLVQDGLRSTLIRLAPDARVACASALEDGLALLRRDGASFDLTFLDLSLPGHFGLSALWTFREQMPAAPVVIFSGDTNPSTIHNALSSGARGFVTKNASPEALLNALELIFKGGIYIPPEAVPSLANLIAPSSAPAAPPAPFDPERLPRRQREILHYLARGATNKDIARELGVTLSTVKSHVAAVFEAMGTHSRFEVYARMRAKHGWPSTTIKPLTRRTSGADHEAADTLAGGSPARRPGEPH